MSCGRRRAKKFRRKVWVESKGKCFYCRCEMIFDGPMCDNKFTLEHLKPVVFGGKRTLRNIRGACHKCNRERGHKNIYEFVVEQDKKKAKRKND